MELKLFTKYHNTKLLKEHTNNNQPYTSEEITILSSKKNPLSFKDLYKKVLERKEELLEIIQFIKKNDIKKIVSIGSSYPIQEYYISKKAGVEILCYDFDKTKIKNSKLIFKDKIFIQFYDMNMPLSNVIQPNHNINCIIFLQSLYVFNRNQYAKYLGEVNNLKIQYIIDKASIKPTLEILRTKISRIIKFPIKTLLLKFFPNSDKFHLGKFHGYSRNKSNLLKIYDDLNLKIIKSFKNYFFLEKKK